MLIRVLVLYERWMCCGVVRGIYVEGTSKHTNATAGNEVLFWIFPTQVTSATFSSPSVPQCSSYQSQADNVGVLM